MTKRVFVRLFWPLLAVWAAWVLWATSAHAQTLLPPVRGYTTADPVTSDRMGLATPYGRYAIVLNPGCTITELQDVLYWGSEDAPVALLQPLGGGDVCAAGVQQRMAETPCFGDGVCEVRFEIPE